MDLLMKNLFVVVNALEGIMFLLLAAYYTAKPEKSTFLISNYAYFSPEKKARYDLAGLGKHVSRVFTVIGVICLVGAGASALLSMVSHLASAVPYWISMAAWLILALKTLRVDNEKVLRKYRRD